MTLGKILTTNGKTVISTLKEIEFIEFVLKGMELPCRPLNQDERNDR